MKEHVRTLWRMLPSKAQREALLLLFFTSPVAALEAIGIASVLPLIAVIADPSRIEAVPMLARWYDALGCQSPRHFCFWMGLSILALVTCSNMFGALLILLTQKYCARQHHFFCKKLLCNYLRMPYLRLMHQNTSALSKNILNETQQLTYGVLLPTIDIAAKSITALIVMSLIFWIDPKLTLISISVLSVIYLAAYWSVRRRLNRISSTLVSVNTSRFKIVSEALGQLKLLKLWHLEPFYEERFEKPSMTYSHLFFQYETINRTTRYLVETIALGGAMALVLALLMFDKNSSHMISMVGMYAFAAYRLLPAIQNIFLNLTKIRSYQGIMHLLAPDLETDHAIDAHTQALPATPQAKVVGAEAAIQPDTAASASSAHIELVHVDFTYPEAAQPLFTELNLRINKNECVGIAGPTGGGKTTLVDLIMGLLVPESGEARMDGLVLNSQTRALWQSRIGYVPQHIYLSDESLRANIAFGIDPAEIDDERVRQAAHLAHIGAWIESSLPQGYQTIVGERGARLSGGQIQRIGIARALYRNPEVLVFDEATSALDRQTEQAMIDSLFEFEGKRTLILIAHRLETLRRCTRILVIEEGHIVADGPYKIVSQGHPLFHERVKRGLSANENLLADQ